MKHSLPKSKWLLVLGFILFWSYGYPQQLADATLSQDKNQSQEKSLLLKDKLKQIEKAFDVSFMFDPDVLDGKYVSSEKAEGTVEEQLETFLKPLKLSYWKIKDNFYLIQVAGEPLPEKIDTNTRKRLNQNSGGEKVEDDKSIIRRIASLQQTSLDITVRGQVVDGSSDEPLPGVNIMVKDSQEGTVTDMEGNFTIAVPDEETVLVFSFIGYETQEQVVGSSSEMNISLKPDAKALDEVVVIGYGEQKRANLTGSVVNIEAAEIEDIPVGNLSQALIGRLAGVKVGVSTGKPGEANPISIRTTSSYGAPESPLYVIDGIIFDDNGAQFNRLDASEVESVSFLKDGSAAVYGARAAGGVVVVKTKRGKPGKPKISYSSSVGIGSPTQLPEMLSAREHALLMNEVYDYENGRYRNDPDFERNKRRDFRYFSEDELAAMDTLNYNWLDGLYRDAITTRHTLNVSGGGDHMRYFVGGSYFNETGNIENLSARRYSFRANVDADITSDLTLTVGLSTNRGSNIEPYYGEESSPGKLGDFYNRLLTAPRYIPPTVDGLPVFVGGTWNPYGLLESNNYKSATSNNTNITGALEYRVPFIEGLKLNAQLSYNESAGRGRRFAQDYYAYNFRRAGQNKHLFTSELSESNPRQTIGNRESLTESADQAGFYQLNTSVSYNRSFGKHNLEALLVYEQQESDRSSFNVVKNQADIKGFDQLWAFTNNGIEVGSSAAETGRLASIGRLNYNYGEKYLFEGAFRYEASQTFHPDYAWGFFPSLSAGWVISEENFFLDNVSFMDFLKLRASAGRLGNSNVGTFQWKLSYGANTNGPMFGSSLTNAIEVKNNGIYTPTLTWQKTDFYNVGLDTRFLNHRINLGIDAYYKYTFDILDRRNTAPITLGVERPPHENYGIMFAQGVEVQLGFSDNIGRDFKYSIDGNISWDYARRLKVFQNPAVIGRWDDYLLNHPSNQPGWIAGGIIRTDADLDHVLSMYDSIGGVPVQKGMIWYHDIRGENYSEGPDGKIDGWDQTIIAEFTTPPYNYGLAFGFSWKGLSLGGAFSGVFGHKVFIQKDEQVLPGENRNVFAFWNDYWSPDNPDAAMPRPYQFGMQEQHSTFWMRDGHTLRLNNVNLSYALPADLTTRLKLPQFRVYFTGTNIWTVINPFDHKDPSVARAYDYPLIRTYNFGLNISL